MSNLGHLNIQLSLDSVQFIQNMDRATKSAQQFAKNTQAELASIEKNVRSLTQTADKANFWGTLIGYANAGKNVLNQVKEQADKYTELSNKIKLVTETEQQHARAMSDVYDISMKTAQSAQAVSSVYQTFAQNAKELGINQHQVAEMTEIISKAVSISGASTSEAQNALTQFSQVLLMGKFRAQEYNSVMTQPLEDIKKARIQ